MTDFAHLIQLYRDIRDQKKVLADHHKEEMAPLNSKLDELEGQLLAALDETGQDSAKTASGTAYKTIKKSATLEDPAEFFEFVKRTNLWELMDRKANAVAVADYVDEHEGLAPPGVNFTRHYEVGVRAPVKPTK